MKHYMPDNNIDNKSNISYSKKLDNPLNITNFNISENNSKNNDKEREKDKDSIENINDTNYQISKKVKIYHLLQSQLKK